MPHSMLRRTRGAAAATALAAAVIATGVPQAAAAPGSTAPGSTARTAAAQATAPQLKVLSYNVFLFSKNLYPNWGQDHRAQEIAAAGFMNGNDVVVLQEAFDNSSSDALMAATADRYPYRTPVVGRSKSGWDATGGSYSSLTPEDGGVTVLSKWPILRKEQHVFKDACGSDWFSNKGFAYAVLDVGGARVHVVGTHLQSTDTACSAGEAESVRGKQLRAIDAFLDAKAIPAGEQVIVAGDLNVDSRTPEYASMLANGDLAAPDARTGHPYSFDTQDNSVAADRYPGYPREDLDYVLLRNGHARPAAWRNDVIKEQSAPWTVTSGGKQYTYTNLSDHYPVVAGDV
ncbi:MULTISPECIES: sphingomyelin phosphodiesterase [Streptomyces]|uniref:sphingomyelin phosphodiesterase n=1 Tax=Streptomyces TaxID=1883 RepID=UPI0021754A16|nr:sphingomyelin phosphodiesterase [Streptomyces sp. SCUT-3]